MTKSIIANTLNIENRYDLYNIFHNNLTAWKIWCKYLAGDFEI